MWWRFFWFLAAIQVDFLDAFCLRLMRHATVALNNEASNSDAETLVHPMSDEESFLSATHGRVGNVVKDLVARRSGCSNYVSLLVNRHC